MPSSLPSENLKATEAKPLTMFASSSLNRPSTPSYKPVSGNLNLMADSTSLGKSSVASNVSKVQESTYGKLKIPNLDLDEVVARYPNNSTNTSEQPKYLRFNI